MSFLVLLSFFSPGAIILSQYIFFTWSYTKYLIKTPEERAFMFQSKQRPLKMTSPVSALDRNP